MILSYSAPTNACDENSTKTCEGKQPASGHIHAEVTISCKTTVDSKENLGKRCDCKLGTYNTFPTTNHLYKFKNRSSSEIDSRKVFPNRLRGWSPASCSLLQQRRTTDFCVPFVVFGTTSFDSADTTLAILEWELHQVPLAHNFASRSWLAINVHSPDKVVGRHEVDRL